MLAGNNGSGEDDGWRTQGSNGAASSARDHWSGDDSCNDGGRLAALWIEDERREEKIVRGAGLMVQDEADYRFVGGKTLRERATAEIQKAAAQEEAVLAAELAAVEAPCESEAKSRGQTAGARDRLG